MRHVTVPLLAALLAVGITVLDLTAQGATAAADVAYLAAERDAVLRLVARIESPLLRVQPDVSTDLVQYLRFRSRLLALRDTAERAAFLGSVTPCPCCCAPKPTKSPAFVFATGARIAYFGGSEPTGTRVDWTLSTNLLGEAAGKLFGALGGSSLAKELGSRVFIDLAAPIGGELHSTGLTSALSIRVVTVGTDVRFSASYVMQSMPRALVDSTSSVVSESAEAKTFSSPGIRFEVWKTPRALPAEGVTPAAWSISLDLTDRHGAAASPGDVAKNLVLASPPDFVSWDRWQLSAAASVSFWVMR